jgi:hypothetical protein
MVPRIILLTVVVTMATVYLGIVRKGEPWPWEASAITILDRIKSEPVRGSGRIPGWRVDRELVTGTRKEHTPAHEPP